MREIYFFGIVVARTRVLGSIQRKCAIGLYNLPSCSKSDSILLEILLKIAFQIIIGWVSGHLARFGQVQLVSKTERTSFLGFCVRDIIENVWRRCFPSACKSISLGK